jgi:exosome complex exonuclease DIS3/RRP44
MLRSKVILRKTNRGNVVQVVREHYLRDDIGCGAVDCPHSCPSFPQPAKLTAEPRSTALFPFPHYLLIDTGVALQQVKSNKRRRRKSSNLFKKLFIIL